MLCLEPLLAGRVNFHGRFGFCGCCTPLASGIHAPKFVGRSRSHRGVGFVEVALEQVTHLKGVAEPPKLFQLKCLSHASRAATHLNRNNPSVPQI
jgi:hypothetical protein